MHMAQGSSVAYSVVALEPIIAQTDARRRATRRSPHAPSGHGWRSGRFHPSPIISSSSTNSAPDGYFAFLRRALREHQRAPHEIDVAA